MIDLKPLLDRVRPVVCATDEFASAAHIADPVDFRSAVALVIAGATMLTVKTSGEPRDKCGLINLELDNMVEAKTTLRQHLIQRLGLRQRPREAVEDKAVSAIRLGDPVGDHI